MKKTLILILLVAAAAPSLFAQGDVREVRQGNRLFKKGDYKQSEISYRKGLVKDSTSFAGNFDLASSLYMQKDYQGAAASLGHLADQAPDNPNALSYYFNKGDVALQTQDYKGAVDSFREVLLRDPDDEQARESYVYAKRKLQQQQNQQQQQQQNQNQDQNQNKDQNQDRQQQQQNQNKNQQQDDKDQQQQQQPQDQKISPQQAQQIMQAMLAREKETQDKVNKEKAAAMRSRQKEKNW